MKNQYVGDIGDYTKLGLLRAIEKTGISIGVNWYLTQDDHRTDGRLTQYLDSQGDMPDTELFCGLRRIVTTGLRSVYALQDAGLFKKALFYSEILNDTKETNRQLFRTEWHHNAQTALRGQEVIFLDPDNGLETKSIGIEQKNGYKYVAYQEAADYYQDGASVIVYQHRDRSPEPKYIEKMTRFRNLEGTANAEMLCLTAFRHSVRDYLILSQPGHRRVFQEIADGCLHSEWKDYLRLRNLL